MQPDVLSRIGHVVHPRMCSLQFAQGASRCLHSCCKLAAVYASQTLMLIVSIVCWTAACHSYLTRCCS
eukprot:5366305-Pyramimonas_sp.AAC.1